MAVSVPRSTGLDELVAAFRERYWLRDPTPLLAVLGTVAANRMSGEPLWLMLVGPPSGGKSELLSLLSALPEYFGTSTLTEAGLFTHSGEHGSGGLLTEVVARCAKPGGPAYGLVVVSDFGTLLSGHHDTRDRVFALLRVTHDGLLTRRLGTNHGMALDWSGKVGLIAGSTEAVDLADFGVLGERFAYVRLTEQSSEDETMTLAFASKNVGTQSEHRERLAVLTAAFFASVDLPERPPAIDADHERVAGLARLGSRCRSAVPRDGSGSRDILALFQPERPARLYQQLVQLLAGLRAIGADDEAAWRVVRAAALNGMVAARRAVIDALVAAPWEDTTTWISDRIGLSRTATQRCLEDLAALKVVIREDDPDDPRRAPHWCLSEEIGELWEVVARNWRKEERVPLRLVDGAFPGAEEGL
jgi:hypothetical protein